MSKTVSVHVCFACLLSVFEAHVDLMSTAGCSCRIANCLLEYSPGILEGSHRWPDYPKLPAMLQTMLQQGFTLLHVRDDLVRTDLIHGLLPGGRLDWTRPLPGLEEITADNLQYDAADAARLANLQMGCPKPDELRNR